MEKAFEIQRQARDNAKTIQSYLTDLQNWETEMKRKEAAINGEFEQVLPPVRSKAKREKQGYRKKRADKRITSSDYGAWDKFDVEKACEEVDMADIGPVSLDGKMSMDAKKDKLKEEAQYEKNRGNVFVKLEKWDDAISCYNRAIELVKDDAIYYANRGLCHLMKDSLHQAISDCNEALKLDPTYVKAYQRRASASEKLGSLRAASQDLLEVIRLEPHNNTARKQLEEIKKRMGTKGTKSKSSPQSTPVSESKPFVPPADYRPKIIELSDEPTKEEKELNAWRDGVGEDVNVIKPVKKPPHLRSKRALKNIPIHEIPLGRTDNAETDKTVEEVNTKLTQLCKPDTPESNKLLSDVLSTEKRELTPPTNSVQFMSEWKYLKNKEGARSEYLSIIDPDKIPAIFANALESDVLSDILRTLHADVGRYSRGVAAYLLALTKVKRFTTLTLFLTKEDKDVIKKLMAHCEKEENLTAGEVAELMELYEV